MREPPRLSEEELRASLEKYYHLRARTLAFLGLGLNYQAGMYRVAGEDGVAYALKAARGPFYAPACLVPAYLKGQGIAAVVAPLRSTAGDLWARCGDWTVALYPFFVGTTDWTGMTDAQWRSVGETFRRIHQASIPTVGFETLRRETFQAAEYTRQAQTFETRYLSCHPGDSEQSALLAAWQEHRATIHQVLRVLEVLAEVLQKQSEPYVICHADLHPANLLRDEAGQVFVLDWDDVMLAPKERDFLFGGEPASDGSLGHDASPFFQGYGQTQINWPALVYYRYERIAQDLLVCAQNVFEHPELGSGERAYAAHLFQKILTSGATLVHAFTSLNYLDHSLRRAMKE